MICKKCGKNWKYKGNKTYTTEYNQYVSCPRCRTQIRITGEIRK